MKLDQLRKFLLQDHLLSGNPISSWISLTKYINQMDITIMCNLA